MLDYEAVKDFYTEKLINDRKGRGRMESAAFHTVEWAYLQGVKDGGLCASMLYDALSVAGVVGHDKNATVEELVQTLRMVRAVLVEINDQITVQ